LVVTMDTGPMENAHGGGCGLMGRMPSSRVYARVTQRERERVKMLLKDTDMSMVQIAERMSMSSNTVSAINAEFKIRTGKSQSGKTYREN